MENWNLINDPNYAELIDEYKVKLEALKVQWDYINLSDTLVSCFLDSVDSSAIDTSILLGIQPPVENSFEEGTLRVYPNPANYILTVALRAFTSDAEIAIYDGAARLMYRETEIESRDLEVVRKIDVSAFPSGPYLINIRCNGRSATVPFVKH